MQFDTHVHYLDPIRFPFPPVDVGYVPHPHECRDMGQLLKTMDAHGVQGAVLVPASVYGPDNSSLLAGLKDHPDRLRAVVFPPENPDELHALANHPGVVGARINCIDAKLRNPQALAQSAFEAGLVVHIQATPEHALDFVERFQPPAGKLVIEHFARPDKALSQTAMDQLLTILSNGGIWLKASAAFRLGAVPQAQLAAIVHAASPNWLLTGTDWPFINHTGEPAQYQQAKGMLAQLLDDEAIAYQRQADLNAQSLYRF